jgi:sugar lactone lactonase YvrE
LGPGLIGALAASGPDSLWIGTYEKSGPGRIFEFPAATLRGMHDGQTLTRDMAIHDVLIPSYAQGAALDPDGRHLWISRSGLDWASLDWIDRENGTLIRRFQAPGGLEGIVFDESNHLWAVSEAGARHIYNFPLSFVISPFNPLIFAFDLARLQSD